MLDAVYTARIIELAGNIGHIGRLPNPDGASTQHAKICGSTLSVEVTVNDGLVTGYAQQVKACALGQAAAAIVAQHAIGAPVAELRGLAEAVRAMLQADGPPPGGRWKDVAVLQPVRDYSARHASTLLVFEALAEAAEQAITKTHV